MSRCETQIESKELRLWVYTVRPHSTMTRDRVIKRPGRSHLLVSDKMHGSAVERDRKAVGHS